MERIAIKIGSNVLTGPDGALDTARMASIAAQVARLHRDGCQIALVSSGAVAAGRGMIRGERSLDPVAQRQLYSSMGQVTLIGEYQRLFGGHGIQIGQVLLTKQDLSSRSRYLNVMNCIGTLWHNSVIPVINENDTVSLTGLMFTDNDELSGLIASMMDCQKLFILSNVDGVYNGSAADGGARLIREVPAGASVARFVRPDKSGFGRGGMITKCRTAQKTAAAGIEVYIANGAAEDVIVRLESGDPELRRTHFEAGGHKRAIKKWIASSEGFASAKVVVNKGAEDALTDPDRASSLLPVGVREFAGDFKKDDILLVVSTDGRTIGVGRAAMDKETAQRQAFAARQKPLIHYDYLYIYPR